MNSLSILFVWHKRDRVVNTSTNVMYYRPIYEGEILSFVYLYWHTLFDPCVLIHSSAIFGHFMLSKPKATLTQLPTSASTLVVNIKQGHGEFHAWSNDFGRFCMRLGQIGQSNRFSPGTLPLPSSWTWLRVATC